MNQPDPKDLKPVCSSSTEFGAQTKAAVLKSEGIDAFVFGIAGGIYGGMNPALAPHGIEVWVRLEDFDRAKMLVQQRIADSVDLDWDEIDVGEREDTLPLRPIGSMPLPAKIAATVVALTLIASVIGTIIMMIL